MTDRERLVSIPRLIAGQYEVVETLRQDGTGIIFRVRRELQTFVLKILPDHVADDPGRVARFRREAQRLARFRHDHIARVSDFGRDGAVVYVVQSLISGPSLRQVLNERGRLPLAGSLEVARQIASALAYAHTQRLTHRHVNPDNIVLKQPGPLHAVLIDFGIGNVDEIGLTGETTQSDVFAGTYRYAAPEQLGYRRGRERVEVGPQADQWGLALVLQEMVEGRPLFAELDIHEVIARVTLAREELAPEFSGDVPIAVQQLVGRALRRDPEKRYPSMADLLRDIEQCISQLPPAATDLASVVSPLRVPSDPVIDNVLPMAAALRMEAVRARAQAEIARKRADAAGATTVAPAVFERAKAQEDRGTAALQGGEYSRALAMFDEAARIFAEAVAAAEGLDRTLTVVTPTVERVHDSERDRYAEAAIDDKTPGPRRPDENVQFTVYRPRQIVPERWYPILAFAHLAERRLDVPDSLEPLKEVARQAEKMLGESVTDFTDVTQDSRQAIPRDGDISFVLEIPGLDINPRCRSFRWLEDVHREDFRIMAPLHVLGKAVRGALTVFLGSVIVAEVSLAVYVTASDSDSRAASPEKSHASPYRKIFASYSHRDEAIVRQFELLATALGDEYVRDWTHLRTGEVWTDELGQMIRTADIFQLFWSHHSMRSDFVRSEWEYALSLDRAGFVRPTYWQDPLPRDPARDLPPPRLARLHFQRLPLDAPENAAWKESPPGKSTRRLKTIDLEAPAESASSTIEVSASNREGPSSAPRRWSHARGPRVRNLSKLRWSGVGIVAILALWTGLVTWPPGSPPPQKPPSESQRPGGEYHSPELGAPSPDLSRPFRFVNVTPATSQVSVEPGREIEFSVAAADPQSLQQVQYSWSLDGREVQRSALPKWVLRTDLSSGSHAVEVAFLDQDGRSDIRRWNVDVVAAATPVGGTPITESDVRDWLARYTAAWRNRDVKALRTLGVVTDEHAEELHRTVGQYKDLRVSVTNEQISVEGRVAKVYFDRTDADETGTALVLPRQGFELKKDVNGVVASKRLPTP